MSATRGFFVPPTRGSASPAGKMQKSVMPATASPAPRSKSVSVREGTSETTRRGGASKRCSRPRTSRTMRVFYASVRLLQIWAAVAAIALAIHLGGFPLLDPDEGRSEEHTSELQSRELISYA